MTPRQENIQDGKKRSLKEFADHAVEILKANTSTDEVVQLANGIIELEHDAMMAPQSIYPLPDGFEYNFSGFFGQVIGVGRTGIRLLHKGD